MTDRAFDPIDQNPFGQFDPNAEKLNYEPSQPVKSAPTKPSEDPFANFDTSASKVNYPTDASETSATGAFTRSAARSALPAIGSFPAIGAGAEAGAFLGTFGGPLAPLTVPAGALVGGIAGGLAGSYAISTTQNWALSKLPESWRESIGQDEAQQQRDEKEHATASFLGGLLPYAITMKPGFGGKTVTLPENATAMQRIMAHPATARVFGGAVMGGMELGQEAVGPNPVEWSHVAIATGFGVVFNRPTRIGKRLTEIGAKPARALLGRPEPVSATEEPGATETALAEAIPTAEAGPEAIPAAPTRYGVDLFTPPAAERPPLTVADANDLGVMGPGVTQATFEGGHTRASDAARTAAEMKREEQAAIGPDLPPDVHHAARTMHPELFAEYEDLKGQQREFETWVSEHRGDAPHAAAHLEAINKQVQALEPEVAAAYRRAAEAHGAQIHEEEPNAGLGGYLFGGKDEAARGEQPVPKIAETVKSAAVMVNGKIYEGASHLAALEKVAAELGTTVENIHTKTEDNKATKLDAWVTSTGRLIDSKEAAEIAKSPHEKLDSSDIEAPKPRTIEQQRDFIRNDVEKDLIAAGRPKEEAQAAAALIAARYEARAARFQGKLGTPEELYRVEHAEILGPGQRNTQARPWQPRAPAVRERISLLQFIAQRGGIKVDDPLASDVRSTIGRDNKLIPGFGPLIRKTGIPLDRLREAAVEAGYLPPHSEQEPSTVRSLIDAITAEEKGRTVYKRGEELATTNESRDDHLHAIEEELNQGLRDVSIDPNAISDNVRMRAVEIMDKEHERDPVKAYERAEAEEGLFQAARGKIALLEGRRPIISLMKDANASTFIHETGHEWLEQMRRDAKHEAAPESVKQDSSTINKWLGIEPGTENIPTKAHEKFARGFEQYLREGVAPSRELANVFARFKQWLTQIYQTLKGLGQPINDDIKQVFDRMLSAEPQRTVIAPERAERPTLSDIHNADATEASPHEADPVADRIYAEKSHYIDNIPEDIRNEHETALEETARLEAEGYQPGAEPGAAAEPSGEVRAGEPGRGEVVGTGAEPGAEPESRAGGAEHGAIEPGGTEPSREGAQLRGTEQRPGDGEESQPVPLAPSPAADFNAGGSTFNVGKDGNIRTENITSVPQLMNAIEESKTRIGGSGKLTMGEMLDTAERLGLNPKDINEERLAAMFGGATDLAPKIMALRTAIEAQTHTVHSLAQAVRDGGSDMVVAEFVKESSRFDMMMSVLSSITTETGRALGMAFRNLDNLKGSRDLNQLIQDNTGRTLFQHRLTANLAAAMDTPAKVSKFLVDSNKRSFGKMILEYWINGLLSGPATHSTNIIGNAILAIQHSAIETPLAAGIGAIRRGLGREGEIVHIGELGARGHALAQSLPSALKATAESFKSSTSVLLPGEEARPLPYQTTADLAPHSKFDETVTWQSLMTDGFGTIQGLRDGIVAMGELVKAGGVEGSPAIGMQYSLAGAIPDIAVRGINVLPLGTIARAPGRFLSAADSFFRVLNYSMAKNAMAYRTATEEGHAGTALASRVADIRDNPTEAQMTQLVHEASELTLMNKGGKLLNALQHIAGYEPDLPGLGPTPVFKFVTPFVHVAGNIIKQSLVQRTPLGVFSAEIRADLMGKNGTVAQDMASARMLFGTALAVTLGTLAAQGYASGSGPTDPNEAAMWRLVGNQAHSIRIGDLWYGVQKLGPLGLLMGLSADLYDVSKSASEGDLTEATASLVHAFSQNVLDQSMMKGPAELLKAIQDSDRYGDAYVRSFVAGFVPMSVASAQIARTQDPYSRQTRTVIDAIRNKIPGHLDNWFAEGLYPKRDIWGEPMLAPESVGGSLVTGIQLKQMSTDPVNLAMIELDIHPGKVGKEIRNVELTDRQYDDYARLAGRMTKMRLDTIVRSPDYRSWPNHIKHAVIQATVTQSREAARGMMLMKYPQIVKDATEERRSKFQD